MEEYLPSIKLFFRNDENIRDKRFLCVDSIHFDTSVPEQLIEFFVRARDISKEWGYPIKCSEKEYLDYSQ